MSGPDRAHSARTWVGGGVDGAEHGHLPLPEARRWAVAKLEEAEADLQAKNEALAAAQTAFRAALQNQDAAYNARQTARALVKTRQEDLAWRLSSDEPEEVPK